MNQLSQFAARPRVRALARAVAVVSLLVVGGVHLEQYTVAHYSAIPTIGWLFLMNFIAATILGVGLLAPLVCRNRRWPELLGAVAAIGGLGLAASSLVALLLSEHTLVFGIMEQGYRPAIVVAIAADALAIVALSAVLAWSGGARSGHGARSYPPF